MAALLVSYGRRVYHLPVRCNSILGFGYTWNLPPFRPVEGYTGFLWVVMLDLVWRITGVELPDSANTISLFLAYATTLLGAAMLLRMNLKPQWNKIRLLFLVFVGILTNRTYLTWTSSGLEAAMFNFFMILWVFVALSGTLENSQRLTGMMLLPSLPLWLAYTEGGRSLSIARDDLGLMNIVLPRGENYSVTLRYEEGVVEQLGGV